MITALLFAVVLGGQSAARAQDPSVELASARQLYASASYEEALDRLNRVSTPGLLADQSDTYRALCLLALGRAQESENVVERVIQRNPKYTLDEREVSPRLVMVFRAVQARMLPGSARDLYAAARASFDAKQYDRAAQQFRDVLEMLQAGAAAEAGSSDLKMLAEGFLRQAEEARGSLPPVRPVGGPPPSEPVAPIYSILDRDVIGPVEISRPVPIMEAARGARPGLYQGLLEIVIGTTGRVEQVGIRHSINPEFDAELIAATAQWRFQPATRNGKPVKYRRSYEVIGHSR